MIHYHGTPVSGKRDDVVTFLSGRHALVPYPRKDDLGAVAEICQSFVFDNGAFSIWKKGGVLDTEGYYRWVEDWYKHPGFEWALIPDVIDGDEQANNDLLQAWPKHLPGVPVWHLHESFERLRYLAQNYRTVALGSSGAWRTPGTVNWWRRMSLTMQAICDSEGRPMCRLHGLRMLNPKVFTHLPLASADSTNASMNAGSKERFGIYTPPSAGQRAAVIANRIEQQNSAAVWKGKPSRVLVDLDGTVNSAMFLGLEDVAFIYGQPDSQTENSLSYGNTTYHLITGVTDNATNL